MKIAAVIVLLTVFPGLSSLADPEILIENDTVEFGLVPQRSRFVHDFKVRSIGDDTLIIREIETFCDCLIVSLDRNILPPGDSAIIHIAFDTQNFVGHRNRHPKVHTNAANTGPKVLRVHIKSQVIDSVHNLYPIYVKPHQVVASQFGDTGATEFSFPIINKSDENIPLTLVHADSTFYHLDFPAYVPPYDTAFGRVILKESGLSAEFETSITFWYLNEDSEQKYYSIPVRRNIFRPSSK
ncbi:MAG: DUF1573 domain-containing protein [Candidatus Zixiibacteriota bacterium]|nr:MAG: DUF1573 domain-containing protein [candidate division Zixibacteria bacterium]